MNNMIHQRRTDRLRTDASIAVRGFSLLELILAVSIFAVAASFLLPLFDHYISQDLNATTREELTLLAEAVTRFYRDVGSFPGTLSDLNAKPQWSTTWQGPYIESIFPDASVAMDDFRFDRWLQPYSTEIVSTFTYRIRSIGENQENNMGAEDDLQIDVYIGSVLRDITNQELSELNTAIFNYNQLSLPDSPLSTVLSTLLDQLQTSGHLAADAATKVKYGADGWGNAYIPLSAPVQEVISQGAP